MGKIKKDGNKYVMNGFSTKNKEDVESVREIVQKKKGFKTSKKSSNKK